MTIRKALAAVCILLSIPLLASASGSDTITFELPYGQRKCFSEDLPPSRTVQGTVHVSSGQGEMTLDLFVSDVRGVVYFHKSDVGTVKFSFQTPAGKVNSREMYRFCIVNQVQPHAASGGSSVVRRVSLTVQIANDPKSPGVDRLAKQEHVDKIYSSFMTVSNDVDNLIEKMDELRAQEQLLTDVNEATTTTIFRISVVACFCTIGTAVLNFLSLKTFFKRKKLA